MGLIIIVGILFLLLGGALTKFGFSSRSETASNIAKVTIGVGSVIVGVALGLILTWVCLKVGLFAIGLAMKLFKVLCGLAVLALIVFLIYRMLFKNKK